MAWEALELLLLYYIQIAKLEYLFEVLVIPYYAVVILVDYKHARCDIVLDYYKAIFCKVFLAFYKEIC